MQVNFLVGGEAGQGVQTVGFVLAKVMSRGGLHVFADQDYESRIRGGHNFFRVRAGDTPVGALSEKVDILIALNKETLDLHRSEVRTGGLALFDRRKVGDYAGGDMLFDVPLEKLGLDTTSDKLMTNSVATGAALGLLAYDFDLLATVLREQFAMAGAAVVENNVKAARAGYDFAKEKGAAGGLASRMKPASKECRMLLNGNEALALGAVAAGMKFMAAYPMTPVTSIIEFVSERAQKHNIVVVQPEDEISAINMVIGASYAGGRAMTATSGSGFCLMVEGLGLAGITETPTVVVLGQRPGPAVGLPTRTEQGELLFACFAGTGEFPRAVLTPSTVEGCFHAAVRAFNLAEKYQTLVIIITDHVLSTSYHTAERFDLNKVTIDRGLLLSQEEAEKATDYKRHLITGSGISPRAFPVQGKALVVTDSDEHNEEGHLIEDAETRTAMVLKRLRKLDGLRKDISQPSFREYPQAEATLIGWGSAYGAIKEACEVLRQDGMPANHLHLDQVWPFPSQSVASALATARRTYVVENNATGQLARLIRAETGVGVSGGINRFDGRPFSPDSIVAALKKEAS